MYLAKHQILFVKLTEFPLHEYEIFKIINNFIFNKWSYIPNLIPFFNHLDSSSLNTDHSSFFTYVNPYKSLTLWKCRNRIHMKLFIQIEVIYNFYIHVNRKQCLHGDYILKFNIEKYLGQRVKNIHYIELEVFIRYQNKGVFWLFLGSMYPDSDWGLGIERELLSLERLLLRDNLNKI